ncbi:transcription factor tfiiic complex subunit sfc9 [Pyrrhoderma noxium]|uniref:Transcription factor tfiiic complex subunit sfc9 n=1 Tax=Pyrrhoderma noxium TaxID=2282107 RepID=A0A286UJ71_9AGAM|nr:transcription factor tfiiic complex subunit sfc9 [Pyrrhoderma noxium]
MNSIYTALSIPIQGPAPSINCIQWSADGQLIICSKGAIYILTPDLGINFDNHSLLRTDRKRFHETHEKEPALDLGWHKNIIELTKNITHPWAAETQDWGAVTLGSIEISLRAVTISPGNLNGVSTGSGCLLVIMNSNLELTLWCAPRNHLKEAWTKIQDITATLKVLPCPQSEEGLPQNKNKLLKTLQSQATSICWSSQSDFGVLPNPLIDGSLLAIGNRAGAIILMRYDGKQSLYCVHIRRIADECITHLSWSKWRVAHTSCVEAFVACGISNGSVVIVRVRQRLERNHTTEAFAPEFSILEEVDILSNRVPEVDKRILTGLTWIDGPDEKPTLFLSKSGVFSFFRIQSSEQKNLSQDPELLAPPSDPQLRHLTTIRVRTQKTSIDSSSLSPVSGVFRVETSEDSNIIITLFDGSFHVIRNVWNEPLYRDDSPNKDENIVSADDNNLLNNLTSAALSNLARSIFWKVEGAAIQDKDVGRISGATSFDEYGTALWLYESCQPTDFNYKHDAKRNSILVVSQLWQDIRESDLLVSRLEYMFEHPCSMAQQSSSFQLLPVLIKLCQKDIYNSVWQHLIQLLSIPTQSLGDEEGLESYTGEISPSFRTSFRKSITRRLYGHDAAHSLRLRLTVADYCWKMASNESREDFGKIAMLILNNITYFYLKTVLNHLIAVIHLLQEKDLPFVMRIIIQSLLEGSPEGLIIIRLDRGLPCLSVTNSIGKYTISGLSSGHTWGRCSITSFLLSTPMSRTCTGCTRKAFLAPSSRTPQQITGSETTSNLPDMSNSGPIVPDTLWIPDAGRSWIVDELLTAVRSCLYCENRFVRIL